MSEKTYLWLSRTFDIDLDSFANVVECIEDETESDRTTIIRTLAETVQPYNIDGDVVWYEYTEGDELFSARTQFKGYKILFIVNPKEVRALVSYPKDRVSGPFFDELERETKGFPRIASVDIRIDSNEKATITHYTIFTNRLSASKELKRLGTILGREMLCSALVVLHEMNNLKDMEIILVAEDGNEYPSMLSDMIRGCTVTKIKI